MTSSKTQICKGRSFTATPNIGLPKVFSAKAAIEAQNPFVIVRPYHRRLTKDIAVELLADYDLVLDGTDNFDTRYLVNAAAVARAVRAESGAGPLPEAAGTLPRTAADTVPPLSLPALAAELAGCWAAHALAASEVLHDMHPKQ